MRTHKNPPSDLGDFFEEAVNYYQFKADLETLAKLEPANIAERKYKQGSMRDLQGKIDAINRRAKQTAHGPQARRVSDRRAIEAAFKALCDRLGKPINPLQMPGRKRELIDALRAADPALAAVGESAFDAHFKALGWRFQAGRRGDGSQSPWNR